ncbi:metallophosphoesterase [Chelatococcus sp. SYSU_G07232]|uniref:Metallophosphoesterase n=1 Tax=Chelatococcus albus TaxID=3047466 RepID=A0ABT7AIZ1_9HYPH|nr:metallophosphoesterase [Chelatococcus sp. SYSU_G07232]MDJ1159338.1 metallophosphoesterase [Chelatococcus sp. SYSU_G07232]
MVLVAHLSDPHIGPLPQPRMRELMSKRLTGYVNWRRGRKSTHDMGVLDRILADLAAQEPDHIAFTGDVANIGLTAEFPVARAFLERLGPPERVSFVPGNHDAYVRGSLKPLGASLGAWMTGDGAAQSHFPYVRRRDGIAFVGLSSAVPTLPFVASGTLGPEQVARMEELLAALREEKLCRVVMLHHPPYRGGAKIGRQLTDAEAFERAIGRVGAEIVLHGHNHRTSLIKLRGPEGDVPVLGAPSASAVRGAFTHRAGYHLVSIEPDGTRSAIKVRTRGLLPDGKTIGDLGEMALDS